MSEREREREIKPLVIRPGRKVRVRQRRASQHLVLIDSLQLKNYSVEHAYFRSRRSMFCALKTGVIDSASVSVSIIPPALAEWSFAVPVLCMKRYLPEKGIGALFHYLRY